MTTTNYVVANFGAPSSASWPYIRNDRSLPAGLDWVQLDEEAKQNRVRLITTGLPNIPRKLSEGHPVLAGAQVDESWYRAASGTIRDVNKTDPVVGFHAIVIVGYSPDTKSFKFVNSWGTGWGDHGFGTLSEAAAQQYLLADSIWAVEPYEQ